MNAKKIFTYHAYSKLPVKININKTIDDQVINDGKYFFLIVGFYSFDEFFTS